MITFEATRLIVVAVAVWIPWRILTWRLKGGDPFREAVVAILFGWMLVVVRYTLFPLVIVLYDWRGRGSLVPFASIAQLIRETNAAVAVENIAGNLLLLAPLGILLPLLFTELRRPWPLIWRVAAVSAAIEVIQLITRARSVDIDDVILNVAGAAIAFGIFRAVARLSRGSRRAVALLDRLGAEPRREPLLLAAVPVLLTAAIVVPLMYSTVVSATLGDAGIETDATTALPGATVVGRGEAGGHAFLILRTADEGGLALAAYKEVLPGRYTWVVRGEPVPWGGSQYDWGITTFNVAKGERPTVYVWGSNESDAATVVVRGEELTERLSLPDAPYFAVGFRFTPDELTEVLEPFEFEFLDDAGVDITDEFVPAAR